MPTYTLKSASVCSWQLTHAKHVTFVPFNSSNTVQVGNGQFEVIRRQGFASN